MKRPITVSCIPVVVLLLSTVIRAQQNPLARPPFLPANEWMTVPVPWLPANDPTPAATRQQRDQYFDALIGLPSPLTPVTAKGTGFSDGAYLGRQPEIPDIPNRTIVVATFSAYRSVLSKSGRAVYTEVQFSTTNVFQDASVNLHAGDSLDLVIPGGTVQIQTGAVLSFLTQPRQYSVQPGKTYLLIISFHSNGGFYMLGKSWDLSTGTVQPNFVAGTQISSTLLGLTVQQLVAKLNTEFGIP